MRKITKDNIELNLPESGGTIIVLQRNAEDFQDKPNQKNDALNLKIGQLMPFSADTAQAFAEKSFDNLFSSLDEEKNATIDILVVASDPRLSVRKKVHPESKRCADTAGKILIAVRESIKKFGIGEKQLLNNTASFEKGIVEISEIKGPLETKDFPELAEFLENKAKETNDNMVNLYESDKYKEERLKAGVESPKEVAERLENFLAFSRGSANYHEKNKNRRLIIWAVTHFDIINPYADVILNNPLSPELFLVEHLGGIVLNINEGGTVVTTSICGQEYKTKLKFPIVTLN